MTKLFYKCDPFNFVPFTRTPWAGKQISQLKKKYFPQSEKNIPEFVGESWEVSTDQQFPSKLEVENHKFVTLTDLLKQNPKAILGQGTFEKYGSHFPLLLKWLEASDLLSVQLHPDNSNPMLKSNECGKPEAWLVLNVENHGFVYLGFKENLSQDEIIECLKKDELEKCLHKYFPKKYDYISVPPGCVHAVGPGVLVAEPQYVLPDKIAKTWRISDWKRLYNAQGQKSPQGKPRELHVEESFSSINWSLPRSKQLEKLLIQNIKSSEEFLGNKNNPFALKLCKSENAEPIEYKYQPLVPGTFSLFTVWEGSVTLSSAQESLQLKAGESGFISAQTTEVKLKLEDKGCLAFFALNDVYCS